MTIRLPRRPALAAALVLTASAVAGCGGSGAGGAGPAGAPVVHIANYAFSAPSAPIHPGEKFVVVNDDPAAHTYQDVHGAFTSGGIPGHGRAVVTAPAAGTYQITCQYHPFMHGTLTVG